MSRVGWYSRSDRTGPIAPSPTGLSPPPVGPSSAVRIRRWGPAKAGYRPPGQSSYPPTAARTRSNAMGVWAPPVSLAATPGILSAPRGTEMFQFPRCPPRQSGVSLFRARGCPIRKPLDRPVPARPQSLSWRGHVLPRQPAPRHPPCAHLRGSHVCGTPLPARTAGPDRLGRRVCVSPLADTCPWL
jgi:hypothetical protein